MSRSGKIFKALVFCLVGGVVSYIAIAVGYIVWHTSQCRAFCKTAASLPHEELADFASRCDALLASNASMLATSTYGSVFIRDADTLSRFELAGKRPQDIYVSIRLSGRVVLSYLGIGRMAARIDWQDYSQWGEQVWKLSGTPGEGGSITIYERKKVVQPSAPANRPTDG